MTALALLVRWAHLASSVVLAGTFVLLLLAGRAARPTAQRWERDALALARICVLAALVAGLGALAVQTALLEGRAQAALDPQAIGRVLGATRFGSVWIVRQGLLALLAAFLLLPVSAVSGADHMALRLHCALLGVLALGVTSWAGHAGAVEPAPLLAAHVDGLHLVAVAAWIGGLLPLARLLGMAGRAEGADARPFAVLAARRFSALALACVIVIVATGAWNAWNQVGGIPALVGTPYGRLLILKLALLGPILLLAAINRRRLIPALAGDAETVGRPAMLRLRASVRIEMLLALAMLALVAWMAVTPPGRHVQPTWPFAVRLSWEATASLPGARLRVLIGGLLLLLGGLAVAAGMLGARRRAALATAAGAVTFAAIAAVPPLVVDAYPTTYRGSSVPYHALSIATGADLYARACVSCHEARAHDVTGANVARHTAGDLFWWLTHGIPGTRMPGFGARLSEEARWDLVNFLRASSAAEQAGTLGPVVDPSRARIVAPDFSYAVGPSPAHSLRELRGRRLVLLVLFTLPESRPRIAQIARAYEALVVMGAEVIAVPMRPTRDIIKRLGADPRIFFPVVTEGAPEIVRTYGLFRSADGRPPHVEFLIDREGYLRARLTPAPGSTPGLSPLLAELQRLNEEPQTAAPPDEHVH
ncbi:MAG: hypothetical protein DMD82_00960 [Candidatus Rokuibacteriota bacterium]|nr:MAG: hypothetical protein DMD82_00960 [Candidatus Rokubacteria bacterium]